MKRVAVTGLGPISSLGLGREEVWDSLLNTTLNLVQEPYCIGEEKWGEFYLHKMRRFDIADFAIPPEKMRFIREMRTVGKDDTDLYYFLAAISLALKDSGLQYDAVTNSVGLILSHENPGVEIFFEELVDAIYEICKKARSEGDLSKLRLAQEIYRSGCEDRGYNLQTFSYLFTLAKAFDLHGFSLFTNNACASGLFAMETAARQIRDGSSPAVVVAAVDNPTKIFKYLWFQRKGLYADDGLTRPFCRDGKGIVFGDGGAALVLEDMELAEERGATIYGEYLGGGFESEGWKITVPNITDDSYARSFRKALKAAGVRPEEVEFVNPHGVGMKVTDTYEARTINRVFGERKPLVSAFKPMIGHNLGGSALLETALSLLALQNGLVPGTLNADNYDKDLSLNLVRRHTKAALRTIAKMSCGFAGFNGVSIFRKPN